MIVFFLLIIFSHVVLGALLGVLKTLFGRGNLIVISCVWKIHSVHAMLGEPPLAREVEVGSYAISSPVHMGYGCL